MNFSVYRFAIINILLCAIMDAKPHERHHHQPGIQTKGRLPHTGWAGGAQNPSGGSPGAYYGTGIDPNYGVVKPSRNQPGHNINVIRYGHNSIPGAEHNRNWNQQLRQHYYLYNNNYNNPWQRPNFNNYYNRYPPGSQGWYATGGNYWYNKGQLIIPDVWLLIAGTLASIICTWIINKVLLI